MKFRKSNMVANASSSIDDKVSIIDNNIDPIMYGWDSKEVVVAQLVPLPVVVSRTGADPGFSVGCGRSQTSYAGMRPELYHKTTLAGESEGC